jgi:type IV secretory pathway VirB9-like protein
MNKSNILVVLLLASAAALTAADAKDPKPAASDPLADAQRIPYHLGQTPTVPVELKWKTIFVLPSSEKILDVVCGFKDDWDVYAPRDSNFAMVQPLKAGARTDLAFVTKAGNIYTFAIQDVSGQAGAHAYTQVLIEAEDDKMRAALNAEPKYYSADDVAAFRSEAQKAEKQSRELADKAARESEEAKAAARAEAAKLIKHDYRYDEAAAAKAPWSIASMWHDDKFSYIEANPSEQFAVYEVVDGKPTAINIFPNGDGSFRTDRVLAAGYFKLGKKQLNFSR